ncbi:LysR family transcriptional regulator [Cupriavidus sp. SZY C1]|uniref:LysR family transcriptional regulator n=1 Tax=Cupriavidus sp. SZY C1 TaxID=3055037 RepID=UPI0028B3DF32|nr:LysR family transcriptional regulator [Cupriavidus sp. SZY C1]MDT6961484.1 LysR family transcriptional regulator [Cupriavidus sp. SZY C1]
MERMLQAMEVFARIVECENFTRASNLLGIPKASASLLIQQLELHLQVKLLHRTTRLVRPTAAGMTFYEQCLKILLDITELKSKVGSAAEQASGRLRVELPGDIARQLMPHIARFRLQYPSVSMQISTPRHSSNLIRDGIDCAVRLGDLEDSYHFSRQVGTYQLITVASRLYVSRHGRPDTVQSLSAHRTAHASHKGDGRPWEFGFSLDGRSTRYPLPESIAFDDMDLLLQYGLQNGAVIQVWDTVATPYIASGRLTEVLAHCRPQARPIHAVYACRTRESMALRVFVDWLSSALEGCQTTGSLPRSEDGRRTEFDAACTPA